MASAYRLRKETHGDKGPGGRGQLTGIGLAGGGRGRANARRISLLPALRRVPPQMFTLKKL